MVSNQYQSRQWLLIGTIFNIICIGIYTYLGAMLSGSIKLSTEKVPQTLLVGPFADQAFTTSILFTLFMSMVVIWLVYFKWGVTNNTGAIYFILGILVLYYSPVAGICWMYVGARAFVAEVLKVFTVICTILITVIFLIWLFLGVPVLFILLLHGGIEVWTIEPSLLSLMATMSTDVSSQNDLFLMVCLVSTIGAIVAIISIVLAIYGSQKGFICLMILCFLSMILSYFMTLLNIAAILFMAIFLKKNHTKTTVHSTSSKKATNSE